MENFNLGFHKPKKDQCSTYIVYTNMIAEEKCKNTDYDEHITNKNLARLVKQNLKKTAMILLKMRSVLFLTCRKCCKQY